MKRRDFLGLTTAGAIHVASHAVGLSQSNSASSLPPVRAITRGPKFHWRGYYDKELFDSTDHFVLANEIDFEHRTPEPEDVLRVGMVDLQHNDEWIEIGSTRAWNWQQGCMLQWLPGIEPIVLWNDRIENQFVCHIHDISTGAERTIPHPIYCVSPDGKTGLSVDFRRLNECRPGYGYAGIPDPYGKDPSPEETGISIVNMETGEAKLILSYAQIAAVPYRDDAPMKYNPKKSKHWFNHLLFSPDGKRFLFLHRWRETPNDDSRANLVKSGFSTRMFTSNLEGSDLHVVDPYGKTSHFVWRDPKTIFAWAWHPSHLERFYLYRDKTDQVEVIGRDVMTQNGHNTYLPQTDNQWVLNDTYPDKSRNQNPYLFHVPSERKVPLGYFLSPEIYTGEVRCDNHPSASRSGRQVLIDSPHAGTGRQVYLIDISEIVGV